MLSMEYFVWYLMDHSAIYKDFWTRSSLYISHIYLYSLLLDSACIECILYAQKWLAKKYTKSETHSQQLKHITAFSTGSQPFETIRRRTDTANG